MANSGCSHHGLQGTPLLGLNRALPAKRLPRQRLWLQFGTLAQPAG